jgi:hypothetical protein
VQLHDDRGRRKGSGGRGSAGSQGADREIKLPPLSGKPPAKTTAPLTKAQLDALSLMKFDDFELEMSPYPTRIAIRQRAKVRPNMSVNVTIAHCTETAKCRPMTLEAWRADEHLRTRLLGPELVIRPDSILELGATTIGGAPAVFAYQAGWHFGKDENGNPGSSYSHAYTLYYNDQQNSLTVAVSYTDHPKASLAEMMTVLPKARMAQVAAAFMDAYGQAWATR